MNQNHQSRWKRCEVQYVRVKKDAAHLKIICLLQRQFINRRWSEMSAQSDESQQAIYMGQHTILCLKHKQKNCYILEITSRQLSLVPHIRRKTRPSLWHEVAVRKHKAFPCFWWVRSNLASPSGTPSVAHHTNEHWENKGLSLDLCSPGTRMADVIVLIRSQNVRALQCTMATELIILVKSG